MEQPVNVRRGDGSASPARNWRSIAWEIAPWRQRISQNVLRGFNAVADWLIAHWLGVINWGLGVILALSIITPILAWLGIEPLAGWLFKTFHSICDQVPSHSIFLFGHQMALCSRNFSLYFALWLGTMLFRFVRHRVGPLDWRLLILFLLPMALDGGTQMFGLRESNLVLRIITGLLFGTGISWFAVPFVQRALDEIAYGIPIPPVPPAEVQHGQP